MHIKWKLKPTSKKKYIYEASKHLFHNDMSDIITYF